MWTSARALAAAGLRLAVAAGLAAILTAGPAAATFLPAERIPTERPIYRDLERLAARYGSAPRFLSTRPLRNAEVLAFLDALLASHAEAERDPAYTRARRALAPDAPGGRPPLISRVGAEGEAAEISPYLSVRYSDDPRNRPDIDRDYRAGAALSVALDSSVVLVTDLYAGTASQGGRGTPDFGRLNALIEGVDFNTWVDEAYVEARLGRLRALAGHARLRWGPGREGTLALSDAAPALDLLRGEIGLFGDLRAQWFVSLLDPGPQTYLAGHRVEAALGRRVAVGFTELARFDGTSQAPLYLMPLVPYSFWEKRPKSGSLPGDTTGLALPKNNVLWSADVAWMPRAGWRAWGELLVDDISFSRDYKPDMIGYQAGVEWRGGAGSGGDGGAGPAGRAFGAALEYTRVHNFTYSAWHGHDFAHEGYPVGFGLGPDVASLGGELSYELGSSWEFRVRGEWRKKGEGGVGDPWLPASGEADAAKFAGVAERETRGSVAAVYSPSRLVRVEVSGGSARVENLDHVGASEVSSGAIRLATLVVW